MLKIPGKLHIESDIFQFSFIYYIFSYYILAEHVWLTLAIFLNFLARNLDDSLVKLCVRILLGKIARNQVSA